MIPSWAADFQCWLLKQRKSQRALTEAHGSAACSNDPNIVFCSQLKVRTLVIMFYTLSIALLWYVRPRCCRSYIYTWYGMLPLQVRVAHLAGVDSLVIPSLTIHMVESTARDLFLVQCLP